MGGFASGDWRGAWPCSAFGLHSLEPLDHALTIAQAISQVKGKRANLLHHLAKFRGCFPRLARPASDAPQWPEPESSSWRHGVMNLAVKILYACLARPQKWTVGLGQTGRPEALALRRVETLRLTAQRAYIQSAGGNKPHELATSVQQLLPGPGAAPGRIPLHPTGREQSNGEGEGAYPPGARGRGRGEIPLSSSAQKNPVRGMGYWKNRNRRMRGRGRGTRRGFEEEPLTLGVRLARG